MILIVLLLVLIVLVGLCLYISYWKQKAYIADHVKVFQFNADFTNLHQSDQLFFPFNNIAKKYDFEKVQRFSDANLIMFSDYLNIDFKLHLVPYVRYKPYFIYGLRGSDLMASKSMLAKNMKGCSCIPKSYVLSDQQDLKNIEQGKIYIVKKNIQRQEGNLITRDVSYIINKAAGDGYVVAQELLQDPYLLNKMKINLRIYLMIVINQKKIDFFIYNNGFVYYTKKSFVPDSDDKDVNVTTGYIDRKVYDENPLTLQDFYDTLSNEKETLFKNNLVAMFKVFKQRYEKELLRENEAIPGVKFNMFGVDVAPSRSLDVTLIEVNKGMSLQPMDKRDALLKYNLVKDCFGMVELVPDGNKKNFIHI